MSMSSHQSLSDLICLEIQKASGWLGFEQFMAMALYAPGLGYYSGPRSPFGAQGDFVTAPAISPWYGDCLARQIIQVLERWQYDDVHGSLSTLNAHGHDQLYGITANQHHAQSHVLASESALGPDHTVSGLTAGHVLTALSSTTPRRHLARRAPATAPTRSTRIPPPRPPGPTPAG